MSLTSIIKPSISLPSNLANCFLNWFVVIDVNIEIFMYPIFLLSCSIILPVTVGMSISSRLMVIFISLLFLFTNIFNLEVGLFLT